MNIKRNFCDFNFLFWILQTFWGSKEYPGNHNLLFGKVTNTFCLYKIIVNNIKSFMMSVLAITNLIRIYKTKSKL